MTFLLYDHWGGKVLIALLLICIVLYTMFRFSLKSIGKLLRFSVQGVEKINDDIKKSSFKNKQMGCLTSSKKDSTFDIRELRA